MCWFQMIFVHSFRKTVHYFSKDWFGTLMVSEHGSAIADFGGSKEKKSQTYERPKEILKNVEY